MVRLRLYPAGSALPPEFPQAGEPFAALTVDDIAELFSLGAWHPKRTAENWSRVAPDGSVWAGGPAGCAVAKVRGKNGRRLNLGCRSLPPGQKKQTASVVLAPENIIKVDRMAAEQGTSRSAVVDALIQGA